MKRMEIKSAIWEIVDFSYANNDFYKGLAKEKELDLKKIRELKKWKEIPIVDKRMLQKNNRLFYDARVLAATYSENTVNKRTSGSTGVYLDVFWNRYDYTRSLLPLWLKRKKYHGINTWDKYCYFYTVRQTGIDVDEEYINNGLGFSKSNLDLKHLEEIYYKILQYEPVWLLLQPSIAFLLADLKLKNNLPNITSLKYIELSGEMLFVEVKKQIEKAFNCTVANQFGCNEVNSIAYDCGNGKFKVMEESVYLEIIDEYGQVLPYGNEGYVCVTSIHNRLLPFIRYKTGDRGILKETGEFELVAGRENDWIVDANGNIVNVYVFLRAVNCINAIYEEAVKEFRFVQHDIDRFEICFVADEDIEKKLIEEIFLENVYHKSLSTAKYNFTYYNYMLPEEESGKLAWFRNVKFSHDYIDKL